MAILSFDQYIAATKETKTYSRTVTRVSVANTWFAVHDLGGNPGAATLAVGNTANGLVPVSGPAGSQTNGYPLLNFSSNINGYLTNVAYGSTVACRVSIYDRLFNVGAFAFNNTGTNSLTAQPSYAGRVPGGVDFTGLQIWFEVTTSFVSGNNWTVAVGYTDQSGNTGHTTGATAAQAAAALTQGKLLQLPLASGDTGVQKIESVTVTNGVTVMTAGNFNIFVARPLWDNRIPIANSGGIDGFFQTGAPQIFNTSCLTLMVNADASSTGNPDLLLTVASY